MRPRLVSGSGVYYARDGAKDGAKAAFTLLMKFALIKVYTQFNGVSIDARRVYQQTTNCRKLKHPPIVHERRKARSIDMFVSRFLIVCRLSCFVFPRASANSSLTSFPLV